jgi:peptide/nickel transport system permease protein
VTLSVVIGITSGYLGGVIDDLLSALANVFLVIPALPLIIIISATIKTAGDLTIALTIGFTSWAWGARILRAQTLSLSQRDFVQAAKATGEKTWRIIIFEITPNLTAIIASGFVSTVIFAVMTEITLAFIGVSNTNSNSWNWGTILYWAQSEQALAQGAWWWFVPAGLAIAILGTALALLNFGIDEFVSPRLRGSGPGKVRTADGDKVKMRVGFTPVLMSRRKPSRMDTDTDPVRSNGSGNGSGNGNGRRASLSANPTPVARPQVEQVEPFSPNATPGTTRPGSIKPVAAPPTRKGAGQ